MSDKAQEPEGPEQREVDLTGETPPPGQLPPVDLTVSEPPSSAGLAPLQLAPIPLQREQRRGQIALLLIALLIVVIVTSFIMLWLLPADRFDSLMELLQIIFAPIIGLVGAVTGFYYGGGMSPSDTGEGSSTNE
jgi:hypothetical protein